MAAMLVVESQLRSQLSEALTIISKHDFPANWKDLLPVCVSTIPSERSGYSLPRSKPLIDRNLTQ